jgi:hypothetical protein
MDIYEELVMQFLVGQKPHIFIHPQYSIKADSGEWACPDFVALNFREKIVSVVEVCSGWDVSSLISKTKDRQNQWFARLRNQLAENSVVDNSWKFRIEAFVRVDTFDKVTKAFNGSDDVHVHKLEDIAFRWKWTSGAV